MGKIKMRYREIARRVTAFCFIDITKIADKEKRRNAQAFQKLVEYLAIPAGIKEYTDEMFQIYVQETLIRADLMKQKQEKVLKKVDSHMQKASKKFVAKKSREKFWDKVKTLFNPLIWGKQGKGEVKNG